MGGKIRVVVGDWNTLKDQAVAIRTEVFVHEQNVPPREELDARDTDCLHAVACDEMGRGVGTGRLLPDAHIGRMAVRKPFRAMGIGSMLLLALIDRARERGCPEVVLAAQLHATRFYERHGFAARGDIFLDAGIEHVMMHRALNPIVTEK